MRTACGNEPFWTRHAAIIISSAFCLVGLTYIFASDRVLLWFVTDPQQLTDIQIVKGSLFVITTSILLFIVLYVMFNRVRRAREAEYAASEQFRRMIETTSEGVWVVDADGVTTFVNNTMASMLGRTPGELVGQHHTLFLDEKWNTVVIEQFERRKQRLHDQYECEFSRPDGKRISTVVTASPLLDQHGEFAGALRVVTDVTAFKQTEEALKDSLQSQRQLLNELNHRVRNNLSSLVSLVDMSTGSAIDVRSFAESIRGRIDAMNRAYGLLSSSGWTRQDFRRLIYMLIPGEHAPRVELIGPTVEFAPYLSGAVAITFHELMTNAAHHGALSTDHGRISIAWRVVDRTEHAAQIEVKWIERGGPEIIGPVTPGTGLQLVKGLTHSDLQGSATLDFPREGARHVLRMRLDDARIEEDARSDDATTVQQT